MGIRNATTLTRADRLSDQDDVVARELQPEIAAEASFSKLPDE
jgi:hypothetical protein